MFVEKSCLFMSVFFDFIYGVMFLDVKMGSWECLLVIFGLLRGLFMFCKFVVVMGKFVVMGGWW